MIDLKDVTFVIPFFHDSNERMENLNAILEYLTENFDTNILVLEGGGSHALMTCLNRKVIYLSLGDDIAIYTHHASGQKLFWRTRVLNHGYKIATTPYIANWDCDVFFDPGQVVKAADALRSGADMVYPYNGAWIEIARTYIKDKIITHSNTFGTGSLGGACLMNKLSYVECGMENEYYVSYSPEDVDRYDRILKLGKKIDRVPGNLYHINHPRGVNSSVANPFHNSGMAELNKMRSMNTEQLKEYIKTWAWLHE